eukprot:CAMPEP_0171155740 /NCGR_PEP_ID=MMETSP0790-20130122/1069_1 /TAXON_ID=2925 /ORGANISM="Alexandrium catenella, Strain OF101" /LENGTH=289 /DNA_ID=CAMNT_0011619995 /DNA_START=248 /DNA_END=1115 /DNA_ORIENTATION=-
MVDSPLSQVQTPLHVRTWFAQMSHITSHWPERMIAMSSSLGAPGHMVSQMRFTRSLRETRRKVLPQTHEGTASSPAAQQAATAPSTPDAGTSPDKLASEAKSLRSWAAGRALTCASGPSAMRLSSGCSVPYRCSKRTCMGRACSKSLSTVSCLRAKMAWASSAGACLGRSSSASREKRKQPPSWSKSTRTGERQVGHRAWSQALKLSASARSQQRVQYCTLQAHGSTALDSWTQSRSRIVPLAVPSPASELHWAEAVATAGQMADRSARGAGRDGPELGPLAAGRRGAE